MNQIDICNMALALINRERIDSLEDSSQEAKMCKTFYDHERRRLLKMYSWGFARKTDQLALRVNTIPGWDFIYGLPQDCISVLFVFNDMTVERREFNRQDFRIVTVTGSDKVIATNVENAWAEYIYNSKDTNAFSEEFVETFVHALAAKLALPLTSNTELAQRNLQLAQAAMNMAALEDANEQERKTQYPRKYAMARFR